MIHQQELLLGNATRTHDSRP